MERRKALPSHKELVLIAPFDGIGGARRSFELLGIIPALYISIENDANCATVVKRAWREAVILEDVGELD